MSETSQTYVDTFLRKPSWWDKALSLCVRDHRLPAEQIPCPDCQQRAVLVDPGE